MTFSEIETYMKNHWFLCFNYLDNYYSLFKKRKWFSTKYVLVDTNDDKQAFDSLYELCFKALLHDGASICEAKDDIIDIDLIDDVFPIEMIQHLVIVHKSEVHFSYQGEYYWIAYTVSNDVHLTNEHGITLYFGSPKQLFCTAVINNKKLSEIWDEVYVDAC